MSRSTSAQIAQQGIANSQQDQANAQGALSATNSALNDYSSNLSQFMNYGRQTYGQGGEFAADQDTIAAGAAAAGTKAIGGDLALNAMRTGANTASYAPTVASATNQAEQTEEGQLASADATRLQNLTNVNQFGVTASALPAQVQAQLYGTSLGGSNSALGVASGASSASPSLTDELAQDIPSAIGAAGNVGAGFAKASCWVAAAVFGEDFYTGAKTALVRAWLWDQWMFDHWYAPWVLKLYSMLGKRAAKSRLVVALLRPLFERALKAAKG
jgi:hypothetical protein